MGGFALDLDLEGPDPFASGDDIHLRPCRLENETGIVVPGQLARQCPRIVTAGLFVTDEKDVDITNLTKMPMQLPQRLDGDDIAAFHIADARPVDPLVVFAKAFESSGRKDRIEMPQQQDPLPPPPRGTEMQMVTDQLPRMHFGFVAKLLQPSAENPSDRINPLFVRGVGVDRYHLPKIVDPLRHSPPPFSLKRSGRAN